MVIVDTISRIFFFLCKLFSEFWLGCKYAALCMKGHFHSNVAAGLNCSRFRPPVSNWELVWSGFHEKLLCKVMNLKNVPYLCVNFLFLSK